MRLPEVKLDDRTFQDLVNEARIRISQSCPEWTEHNVSDPGITLIEMFAWMTETLLYRVNRIPDRMHVAMLELLGIRLDPPSAARADVRFTLAAPPTEPIVIPFASEVATARTPSEEPIVFATTAEVTVPVAQPAAYVVLRAGTPKDIAVGAGVARPKGGDQLAFASPPQVGDALCLAFDTSLARLTMRVEVDCSQARGAGVDPEDPPLRWEVSTADGWEEALVLQDTTGGFNYGAGVVTLDLPNRHDPATVAAKRAFWLRCRLDAQTRAGSTSATYSHAPEIYSITAAPIGVTVTALHANHVVGEELGESDGTPGQMFEVRFPPVLALDAEETLEVLLPGTETWERWNLHDSFIASGADDPHYSLDLASGTIELGPAVRMPDGAWRQHGRIPPKGSRLRMGRYRHGGGRSGNLTSGALTVLRTPIPGVDAVANGRPAIGGVDAESLDAARQRASLELRTRYRAVTADDFEFLCGEATPRVARALCLPAEGGAVRIHLIPRVEPADRLIAYDELVPDESLFSEVAAYLDERRMVGTHVELRSPRYRGVSVVANVQAEARANLTRVESDVSRALYSYLNPLIGGRIGGPGDGWEFGRALNQGELYGVLQRVPGVDHVKILRVYETDLATGQQEPKPAGTHVLLEADQVIASGEHIVKAELPEG